MLPHAQTTLPHETNQQYMERMAVPNVSELNSRA